VVVVEHDLAVLDYMSDYICVLYGLPGAYGTTLGALSPRGGPVQDLVLTINPALLNLTPKPEPHHPSSTSPPC